MIRTDGIIFDIDGTLWDATGVIAGAWNEILIRHSLPPRLDADRLKREFGKPLSVIGDDLLPDVSAEERGGILGEWIKVEAEAVRIRKPHTDPEIEETLSALSARYPLFIVTNAEQGYIESLYAVTGLGKYFTDQLCHGDTGLPKWENIRLIANRHHLLHPIYVGDTKGDRDAARSAGVLFAHAAYGYDTVPDQDIRLERISDLTVLL